MLTAVVQTNVELGADIDALSKASPDIRCRLRRHALHGHEGRISSAVMMK
jgi:hypothetical protein